jgi:hypothetical protein
LAFLDEFAGEDVVEMVASAGKVFIVVAAR